MKPISVKSETWKDQKKLQDKNSLMLIGLRADSLNKYEGKNEVQQKRLIDLAMLKSAVFYNEECHIHNQTEITRLRRHL